jgi:hypothetical protein
MRFKASIQVRRVVGVILLVCGLQLSGQQRALGAEAEAKAAIFTSFDPRAPLRNHSDRPQPRLHQLRPSRHRKLRAPQPKCTPG